MNFTEINPKIIRDSSGKYVYDKTKKEISKKMDKRIKDLKIPIVYTTLWVSKDSKSDIQVIALDSKQRKQYFYSDKWISKRHNEKFLRMYKFVEKLPKLRKHVEQDINVKSFSKQKTMAFMVLIMDLTNIRIGNKKYLDQNESFGLTTLKKEHVITKGNTTKFIFRGKHGIHQELTIDNPKITNFIKKSLKAPTEWVMKYQSSDNLFYRVSAQDVNNYIHSIIGEDFTCKDFRTHGANKTFLKTLQELDIPESERQTKKNVSIALEKTAESLGNNKATSKKSYVMDYIIDEYQKNPEWIKYSKLIEILKKASK